MQVRSSLTQAGTQADPLFPALSAPPSPRARRAAEANPDSDVVLKIAFVLAATAILMGTSRLLEVISLEFGPSVPYLGVTIYAAAAIVTLVSGRVPAMLTSRAGMFLTLFTAWMLLCSPMSQWKGGTAYMLAHEWLPSTAVFLSCGAIVTLKQCRQIGKVLAVSVLLVCISSTVFSTLKEGRLAMESGTLGNANDLSMLLLITAPFVMVPLFQRKSGLAVKLLAALAGVFVLWVVVRAGSRSGLLALVSMTVALFLVLPFIAKLKMGFTTLVLGGVLLASAPSYILFRYATTFSDPATVEDLKNEAFGSKIVRQQLLRESLDMTLQNPIFGVGPGVFIAAEANSAQLEGRPAKWRLSHNSFTQVSSETGFPGFILYAGALWAAVANVLWIRRNASREASGTALGLSIALLLSLVGLGTNFLFSSNAYQIYLPLLIGLSIAFRSALEREFATAEEPVQAASTPAPMMSPNLALKALPIAPATPPAAPGPGHRYRLLGRPRRLSH